MEKQDLKYIKLIDQSRSNELAVKMKTGLSLSANLGKYRATANKRSHIPDIGKNSLEHSFSNAMKTVTEHQLLNNESNAIHQREKSTDWECKQHHLFRPNIGNECNDLNIKWADDHLCKTVTKKTDEIGSQTPVLACSDNRNEVDSSNLCLRQDLFYLTSKRKLLTRTAVSKNSHRILMMPQRFHLINPSLCNNLLANKEKVNNTRPATAVNLPCNKAKIVFQSDKKDNAHFNRNNKILPTRSNYREQDQRNDSKSNSMFPTIRRRATGKNYTKFALNHKSEQKSLYSNLRLSSCVPTNSSGVFRLNPAPITKELKDKILSEKKLYEADFAKEVELDKVLQALDLSGKLKLGKHCHILNLITF